MKEKLTMKDVTPGVKSAVGAYLMARAYAETMHNHVDKIQREILAESPLTNGHETKHGQPARLITDPKHAWLCDDDAACADYYAECNRRERAAGLKPDDMPDSHCPALVAEDIQRTTERLIIDNAAVMLRFEGGGKELHHRLLCAGLDKYHEFIDLMVKLVVNLPDFKNPLQKMAA